MPIRCPNCHEVIPNAEPSTSDVVVCIGCLRRVRIPAPTTPVDILDVVTDDEVPLSEGRFHAVACDPVRYASPIGVAIAFAIALPTSFVVGFLASFIGFYTYVFVLFPIAIGVVVGGAILVGFSVGRIRSTRISLLVGCIAGITAMVVMHAFDNACWLRENHPPAAGAADTGFFQCLTRRADQGFFMVSNRGNLRNNMARISGIAAYFYWMIEALITTLFACGIPVAVATAPVCSDCHGRKIFRALGFVLVGVDGNSSGANSRCIQAFKAGDLAFFAKIPPARQHSTKFGFAALECQYCPHASEIEVRLYKPTPAAQNSPAPSTLAAMSFPRAAVDYLVEMCREFEAVIDQKIRLERN